MSVVQPRYFDLATGDCHPPAEAAAQAAHLVDLLAIAATVNPVWRLGDSVADPVIHLALAERGPGRAAIALVAGALGATLSLRVDERGFVVAEVEAGGACLFSAAVDRPYEDLELRADPSQLLDPADPPGSMGKRLDWISLSVAHWPVLAAVTTQPWLVATALEEPKA